MSNALTFVCFSFLATYEMIQKIQTLQKRLIMKTEEVVEKDLLIQGQWLLNPSFLKGCMIPETLLTFFVFVLFVCV